MQVRRIECFDPPHLPNCVTEPRWLGSLARLDNAKQPENEDQQQDAAKTDIHDTLLLLVLRLKRGARARRSSRFGFGTNSEWYYFTRQQTAGFA